MTEKTHEPIEGYTLYSNYTPMGALSVKQSLHTLESLTEEVQQKLARVPLEAIRIERNPYLSGWSVYLRNDYAYICEDFERGVRDLLDLYKKAHGLL